MSARKGKVLCALSGGVDSSVAAALLVRAGYAVTGAFMINYDNNKPGSESCWLPDYRDALRVAAHLRIPLIKLDFTKDYSEKVLKYLFKEYKAGRTPNPDVLCNTFIKFGVWLGYARRHDFDFLATGHYARVKKDAAGFHLFSAKDTNKDQTYFLHQLNQKQLAQSLFPVGHLTKPEVRALARKLNLPTAEKEESMGICFIGEVPMKQFLEQKIPPKPGKIVTTEGELIGTHDGLPFYTIGQRHIGTKGKGNEPLYVVAKRAKTNELVVGFENDPLLYTKEIALLNVHFTDRQGLRFPLQCEVRLRHRQTLQKAELVKRGARFFLQMNKPQRAATPGQFAVIYRKGECLGGGAVT